jgi:hypothetical protein
MTNDLSVADDAGDVQPFPPDMFRLVLAFLPEAGGRPSADGAVGKWEVAVGAMAGGAGIDAQSELARAFWPATALVRLS